MEQIEYRFRIVKSGLHAPVGAKEIWHGDVARQQASQWIPNGLHPELFHHDADGACAQGLPLIRWAGGAGFFRIIAVGIAAIEVVEVAVTTLVRCALDNGVLLSVEPVRQSVSLEYSPFPVTYHLHRVMYGKKPKIHKKVGIPALNGDFEPLKTYLTERIARDIDRQSYLLGMQDTVIQASDIRVDTVENLTLGELHHANGKTLTAACCDAVVRIPALLTGHWAVGAAISRGYGGLRAPLASSFSLSEDAA